jgi:hypothetical protein
MKRLIKKIFNTKRESKPGPIHTCDETHANINAEFDWMNNLAVRCDESGKIKPMEEIKLPTEDKQ